MKRRTSMDKFRKALGNALRARRKALRLSQEEVAERMDLHRNYVSLVERGLQNITLETLFKITDVLNCSPSDLLAEAERSIDLSSPSKTSRPMRYPPVSSSSWRVAENPS